MLMHLELHIPSTTKIQLATILVYLKAPEEGGETIFPLEGPDGLARLDQGLIDYKHCNLGLKVGWGCRVPDPSTSVSTSGMQYIPWHSCMHCAVHLKLHTHLHTHAHKMIRLYILLTHHRSTSLALGTRCCFTACIPMAPLTGIPFMEGAPWSRAPNG